MADKCMSELTAMDICSLLCSPDRDFLVRSNGDQVNIDTLKEKKVGLYFSASWCGPCLRFTPTLIEACNDLRSQGKDFEVIFVSADDDDESFTTYFSKMPWLAVPFCDAETRDKLEDLFNVREVPHLVILDENGKILTDDGVEIIRDYEADAYPFTHERNKELKEQEEVARKEQTLRSILVSRERDFVIRSNGKKVPVSELVGKTVALYFSLSSYRSCVDFTPILEQFYEDLKAQGENFDIILIPLDDDEELFKQAFGRMPWFCLPYKDKSCVKLARYFDLCALPTLVIIGPDGKTLHPNVAEAIKDHGIRAYPFTPEKFEQLARLEKARQEAQTLESILVLGDRDFVIDKSGVKVLVSDLVGKNILLYFSAHWCAPCRAFLPKLIDIYHTIKQKDDAFEVIFISNDCDQASFHEFVAQMPWLALPFNDPRNEHLHRLFKIYGIPKLIAIGPTGKTVTTEAREHILIHGGEAYPFTDEHLAEIEAKFDEMAQGWPEKLKHELHEEHELVLVRRMMYTCDACEGDGRVWSFNCEECDFDLHPQCALEGEKETETQIEVAGVAKKQQRSKDGWMCDEHVCEGVRSWS